jgi:signal transduction histidine kinase
MALTETLAFAIVYFCCGKLGLSMAFADASASAVWPPTGFALAFLLWRGAGHWPGIFLGALMVNVTTQGSLPVTLGIATGNTLEAVIGVWCVGRFAGGLRTFESTRGAFQFILWAALLSTCVSATSGVSSLCLGGFESWARFGTIWLTWWLGDVVSNLIFAPLLIVWLERAELPLGRREVLEGIVLMLLILVVGILVFSGQTAVGREHWPIEFLLLPPLIWGAFRFGPRGAISASFVMSSIAVWGTLGGWGPFVRDDPNESLLFLQAFMGTASMTALVLGLVIAERRRARLVLAEHRDQLEKLVESRTAKLSDMVAELEGFSYSITHDMRGPLRAMQNFATLLEEQLEPKVPASAREYLRRIREAAKRLDLLIQDSLDYSRVVREALPLQEVDLGTLVRGLLESYPNLHSSEADIELQLDGVRVIGNQSGLVQCFSNLLGNAVKFVAPGVRPRVRVSAERNNNKIKVWVVDNGIGIPAVAADKLFGMFQRMHRESEYPGTGMGLAIARKAVERMNGSVGFESQEGKGSRFWVELPAATRDVAGNCDPTARFNGFP